MAKQSQPSETATLDPELRRGLLVLAVLSMLRTAQYGYSLRQALGHAGLAIEEGTLYPLLRRLESQGLLESEWRDQDGPRRRYYTLSQQGVQHYASMIDSWNELSATVNHLIEKQ
ncbi:MAG: PadR family transcriptional regulator [Phycisphaeraceae bacterium]|nr:PadR family transcriptional regulator [Phycisphaerales bacterium]MCB9861164.1 PadR family transcriptional regulator [Phycisphaeraceae bacterium]